MTIYRLTHRYSNLHEKFYAVESHLSEYEINLRCAYIQSIRDRLPLLSYVEAVIDEMTCMLLLKDFYCLRTITMPQRYDKCIDLHQNWIEYCFPSSNIHPLLNDLSVKNAYSKVLNMMYREVKENVSFLKNINSDEYSSSVKEMLHLNKVINGMPVSPSWSWCDVNGHSLSGKRFTSNSLCTIERRS